MFCNSATFSEDTVEDLLEAEGYFPGTQAFVNERARRYMLDPDNTTGRIRLIERDDWDPKIPSPVAIYSDKEVMAILKLKGFEPDTGRFYNERFRLFIPTGPGSGEWRWAGNSGVSGIAQAMAANNNFDVI